MNARKLKKLSAWALAVVLSASGLTVLPVYGAEAESLSVLENSVPWGGVPEAGSVSSNEMLPETESVSANEMLPESVSANEIRMDMALFSSGSTADIPSTAFTDRLNAGEVTVDGTLDEAVWTTLKYEVDKRVVATTLNNTCAFSTAWDENNFYVAVKVKDDTIITDPLSPNIYDNDGIEVFIDPNNDGVYDDLTAHFMFQIADGKWDVWGGTDKWVSIKDTRYTNTELKYAVVSDGYTVELSIPFADMGITAPEEGCAIGLAVCNNDNDSAVEVQRAELHWVKNFDAGKAETWGCAYLSAGKNQMISWPGTPDMDGELKENWSQEGIAQASSSHTVYIASMCDPNYLYLSYEIALADSSKSFGDITKGDLTLFLSGDNDQSPARSQNNHDIDLVYDLVTGTVSYLRTCDSDPGADGIQYGYLNTNQAVVKNHVKDSIMTVEIAVPWEIFKEDRAYLTGIGMESVITVANSQARWSNASSPWSASAGYGTVVLNSKDAAAAENQAPSAPNQINSYSIAQGGTLSGQLNVTDADGDRLVFTLAEPAADEHSGSFSLNGDTGEWTYTVPDAEFTRPEGVNYYVETSDGYGGVFRSRIEIRVEHAPTNLTWYVDGDNGSDTNDGKTRESAFKTIQKAHDVTNPGDTVLIYDSKIPYGWSEENYSHNGQIMLSRSGLPGAYITYKAAPGNCPVIKSNGEWNTVMITGSYLKLEDMDIEGIADEVTYEEAYAVFRGKTVGPDDPEYIDSWGREVSLSNTNGVNVSPAARIGSDGITMDNILVPHHIEIRGCIVNKVSACGLSAIESDYILFENNTITNCCWWDMYASSGISALDSMDTDGNETDYKIIFRNNIVAGNRHFIPWCSLNPPRLSDGNGLIVDSNNHNTVSANVKAAGYKWGVLPYSGRTLLANNLSYENGGSGMHVFDSDHVDMVNNTVYSNVATAGLGYSEFYASQANDINMYNNIIYTRSNGKMNVSSSSNLGVAYDNNLFYNYDENNNNIGVDYQGTSAGSDNLYPLDPEFVNLPVMDNSVDSSAYPAAWTTSMKDNAEKARYSPARNYDITLCDADFTLKEGSPALNAGSTAWSQRVGNVDNRLGVFGEIGASEAGDNPPEEEDPPSEEPSEEDPPGEENPPQEEVPPQEETPNTGDSNTEDLNQPDTDGENQKEADTKPAEDSGAAIVQAPQTGDSAATWYGLAVWLLGAAIVAAVLCLRVRRTRRED